MEINQNHSGSGDNVVNLGVPARHLNAQLEQQLVEEIKKLPEKTPIQVMAIMGDSDAWNFANEIVSYLNSQGYAVQPPSTGIFGPNQTGSFIGLQKNGVFTINIGYRSNN